MSIWIPFDADDDEIAELHVVRDGIPSTLRPSLISWIRDEFPAWGYQTGRTTPELVHFLQSSLRIDFKWNAKTAPKSSEVTDRLEEMGDRTVLRVVDLFASTYRPDYGRMPKEIGTLSYHLDANNSAFELHVPEGVYRLRRRIPEGVEELVQAAIDATPTAGKHLANAWNSAFAMEPNESFAMSEAIRAVEAAARVVVLPRDKKATLGKIVAALRDQRGWTLILSNSDGFPDHGSVLIGMLETLAKAQTDRHSGEKASSVEAQAHVQLASTLVFWFTSGAVVRGTDEN